MPWMSSLVLLRKLIFTELETGLRRFRSPVFFGVLLVIHNLIRIEHLVAGSVGNRGGAAKDVAILDLVLLHIRCCEAFLAFIGQNQRCLQRVGQRTTTHTVGELLPSGPRGRNCLPNTS